MISNTKQYPLYLRGEARVIHDLDYDAVARCATPHQAIRLCMYQVDISEEQWAEYLGVAQGTLNLIINADKKQHTRPRHFPLDWVDAIQRKEGNRAISQYFDIESKGGLYRQRKPELTTEEKAALFDQIQERATA